MSADISELIPEYVASRKGIVQKIEALKVEQETIYHQLRLEFRETISAFPKWMQEEIKKFVAADEQNRRDFLATLIEQMRYMIPNPVLEAVQLRATNTAVRNGQIALDLTTWVSMRNSISFAIDSMMRYTDVTDLEDVVDILREARSYEKSRITPINYMEDLAAPNAEESLVFEKTIILERPQEDEVITISITEFSKRQQEIMHLWINEGLSYSQIAEELGITKDSVAQHIQMARKKAQKLKENHGVQQAFREVINEAPIITPDHRQIVKQNRKVTVKIGEQLTIEV